MTWPKRCKTCGRSDGMVHTCTAVSSHDEGRRLERECIVAMLQGAADELFKKRTAPPLEPCVWTVRCNILRTMADRLENS